MSAEPTSPPVEPDASGGVYVNGLRVVLTGREPRGLVRVVDHGGRGTSREQHVRREVGDHDVGEALHEGPGLAEPLHGLRDGVGRDGGD